MVAKPLTQSCDWGSQLGQNAQPKWNGRKKGTSWSWRTGVVGACFQHVSWFDLLIWFDSPKSKSYPFEMRDLFFRHYVQHGPSTCRWCLIPGIPGCLNLCKFPPSKNECLVCCFGIWGPSVGDLSSVVLDVGKYHSWTWHDPSTRGTVGITDTQPPNLLVWRIYMENPTRV